MAAGGSAPELSGFQLEVARLFFALPASQGFLLAGGAALLAQHLTARPTEDLDFFTAPEHDMIATLDRFADHEIPVPDGSSAAELRAFYATWRSELTA
jgi:Nucleotidyl transferase AbiEii toxin, Type IV TA system